jgi:methyl-accepting chemotaxis protein
MVKLIQEKIGIRIALLVNVFILIVMGIGAIMIFNQQGHQFEKQLLERGKLASVAGAKAVARILEEAVDNGVMPLNEILDTNYEEIPGFKPEKYHTRYDWYTDKAILSLQDEILTFPDILYAVAQDINTYIPTHNTRFNQPITGDQQKDLMGNRTKRFFKDEVGQKASKNKEPGFLQLYPRDTGQMVWDISSPIYVKGKHWGCFRMGFELGTIQEAKKNLMVSLGVNICVIMLVSMLLTFLLINSALKPLSEFTRIASELADGNVDQKIEFKSQDEIGKLADVLERLRVSLKAAMDRLRRA